MIQVVTTPYIEDAKTIQYKGIVTANEVIGVNAISDTIASFSDFFGGMSGEYRSKLDELKDVVVRMIEKEAKVRGANAVIGFSLSFNEISGKGKQMFMASAVGTAVIVDYKNNKESFDSENKKYMSIANEDLQYLLLASHGVEAMKRFNSVPDKNKEAIVAIANKEWLPVVVKYYIDVKNAIDNRFTEQNIPTFVFRFSDEFVVEYIRKLPFDYVADFLYPKLSSGDERHIVQLIKSANIISYKYLSNYLSDLSVNTILLLLNSQKDKYNLGDIGYMSNISEYLHNLPILAKEGEYKSGVFGKKEIKVLCACGKPLNSDGLCSECGKDKFGLSIEQREIINTFDNTIEILKSIE